MKEINIYGDLVAHKFWEDGSEYDLSSLNRDLAALAVAEGDVVFVNLNTMGGCTVTAFGMYNKIRRFASDNKVKIKTRIDGYCASAGVALLLAGDERVGNAYAEPFVHNAWTIMWDGVDKKSAKKLFEDLSKTDNQIAALYADRTSITVEQALELMAADTWITPEQCMEYGFYTELENVATVPENKEVFNSLRKLRNNINNKNDMAKDTKEAKSLFAEIRNLASKYLNPAQNKIVLSAAAEELDFYDLDAEATPAIGDKATYDGAPAGDHNEGVYLMSSGETYKFTGEELTEITPKADEAADPTEAENALTVENEALKAENATLLNSINTLKADVKTLQEKDKAAAVIMAKLSALPDEDEDDELGADAGRAKRDPKANNKGASEALATRNLWANVK